MGRRTSAALTPLLANVEGDAAGVAHGLSLKALIFALLDLPLAYCRLFDLDNASLSILRWEPSAPAKLLLLHDTGHLDVPSGNGAFWEADVSVLSLSPAEAAASAPPPFGSSHRRAGTWYLVM